MAQKVCFSIVLIFVSITTLFGCDATWRGYQIIMEQDDLDEIRGYTTITGDLVIRESQLTDLSGLESLEHVGGDVWIGEEHPGYIGPNPALVSLRGLDNLKSIGGSLNIVGNEVLTSIEALGNLTSIGKNLQIRTNSLVHLNGLDNLTVVRRSVNIYSDSLTDISALNNISRIGGVLALGLEALDNWNAFENLKTVGGIHIADTPGLTNFALLGNLGTKRLSELTLLGNPSLTSLAGLEQITFIGNLQIDRNDALEDLGLTGLNRVRDSFVIRDNTQLCDYRVTGLQDQVMSGGGIGGDIEISKNKDCSAP